jgi:hypothetical protein
MVPDKEINLAFGEKDLQGNRETKEEINRKAG